MKDIVQRSTIVIWILFLPNITYASSGWDYAMAVFYIFFMASLVVLLTVFIISSFLLKRVDFSLTKNIVLRILFSINILIITVPVTFLVSSIFFSFINQWMSYFVWPVLLVIFSIINFRSFLKKTQSLENPFRFHIFIFSWFMLLIFLPYLYIIWFI